jgi:hypothetical protein
MELFFKLAVAWICMTYYSVYLQTNFYGYLVIALGALGNLSAYIFFPQHPQLAKIISQSSFVVFWVGIAVVGTFGRKLERERIRSSSWSQIIRGIVPEGLRKNDLSKRKRLGLVHGLLLCSLFVVIFYAAGDSVHALALIAVIVVYILYFFSQRRTSDV